MFAKPQHHQGPVASAVQGNHTQHQAQLHHMHQTPMNNMAVGAVGIQGCGGVPGVTHMQGGIQHNIGVPGSQTSAHLHGQVMSSEDERKVNHIKEFEIVVASIFDDISSHPYSILKFYISIFRL